MRDQFDQRDGAARSAPMLHRSDGRVRTDQHPDFQRASIGELFKQLSNDSSSLVQQEIQLAKTELRESAATAAGAAGKIGAAVVLALPGIMALTAAIVIGLGILINSYWLSALIVGVVILAVAGLLVKRAVAAFKSGLAPKETIQTVHDDRQWAKDEAQRVKQELTA